MYRGPILKKKSKYKGQILLEVNDSSKLKPKVSFANSLHNLQLKLLSKDINPEKKTKIPNSNSQSRNESSRSNPNSQNNIISLKNKRNSSSATYRTNSKYIGFNSEEGNRINANNKNSLFKNSTDVEENIKKSKYEPRRNSARQDLGKDYRQNFSVKRHMKGDLEPIQEIIIEPQNEGMIDYNYINSFFENEEKKKKINLIEELQRFDREQQIKMEKYIDTKRKRQIDLIYRNLRIYNPLNDENKNNSKENINNNKKITNINNRNEYEESDENKNEMIIEENENKSQEGENYNNFDNNNLMNENNKENYINYFKTETNINDNKNKNNEKNEFQKIKKNYMTNNLFTTKFPSTSYKIKYLDNYFQNDSMSRSQFNNEKEENSKTNISNYYNTFYKKEVNPKSERNINIFDNKEKSNLKAKNIKNINISGISNLIYSNIKNKNNEHKFNHNRNRSYKKQQSYDEIDDVYNMILNSIDEKLYNKNRHKNRSVTDINYNIKIPSSIDRLNTYNNYNNSFFKNFHSNYSIGIKNKYYDKICDKYNKYNQQKMLNHLLNNQKRNIGCLLYN